MVAGGISPSAAMAMSVVVYAGASMLAATQLLAAETPVAVVVLTALFINLRFMMYSASLRQHFAGLPLRGRLLAGYLTADNAYGVSIARFNDQPAMPGKLGFYLGAGGAVWIVWQASVALGILVGAGLPAHWRLEFAAPLAFIALTIPILKRRAMVAAALAAAVTVVLAAGLPFRLGLAAAALVGITAGLLMERTGK
jgi:predicted branched-subunit amino acid permease